MAIDAVKFEIEADDRKARDAFRTMGRAYEQTMQQLRQATGKFAVKAQKAFDKVAKHVKKVEKELKALAVAAAVTTAGMIKLGKAGAKMAMDFEHGLAAVSTLLDGRARQGLDAFGASLKRISEQGDQSLQTLTAALYQTISAGVQGRERQLAFVKQADLMATAGLSDTKTAVEVLATVTNAWGAAAGTAKEVSDVLFTVVKKGVTNFEMLSGAMGNVAGVAQSAGVSYKQTMAALIPLTKVTKDTSLATTLLSNLITSIAAPSAKLQKEFKRLGIETGVAALKKKGLVEILGQLRKATGGSLSEIKKLIPNIRAARAAAVLTGQGFDGMVKGLRAVQHSAGATQDAFGEMSKTFKFNMDRTKRIGESLLESIGGPIKKLLAGELKRFVAWFEKNRKFLVRWAKDIGYAITVVMKPVIWTIKTAMKAILWLRRWRMGDKKKELSEAEKHAAMMQKIRDRLLKYRDQRNKIYLQRRQQRELASQKKAASSASRAVKKPSTATRLESATMSFDAQDQSIRQATGADLGVQTPGADAFMGKLDNQITEPAKIVKGAVDAMTAPTLKEQVANFFAGLHNIIRLQWYEPLKTMATGLTNIWADYWAQMVKSPEEASKNIIPAILDLVGNIALAWAGYFSARAIGYLAEQQYASAILSFAAAGALGVVGGLAKGGASAMRDGGSSGARAASRAAANTRDAFTGQDSAKGAPIEQHLHFGFMAPPTQREAERVAGVVADAFSRGKNAMAGAGNTIKVGG